jgi:uncharacterized secreted protein with C-terminal beta-propeller domain
MNKEVGLLAILLIALFTISQFIEPIPTRTGIKKFSSYQELENFLKNNMETTYMDYYGGILSTTIPRAMEATTTGESTPQKVSDDYSTTNIQVEGVDEADIIKNDDKYIYLVSGSKILILEAYPADQAKILSSIELDKAPYEIFVNNDNLVAFGYSNYYSPSYIPSTFINIYDISDRENPVLTRNISMEGNYFDSRMIGDYVYVVTNRHVNYNYPEPIVLPTIREGTQEMKIAASDIYYFDVPDRSYIFTNVLAVNTQDGNEDFTVKTYLMGYSQNMYVSLDNIYVVYTKRINISNFYERVIEEAIIPFMPFDVQNQIRNIMSSNKTTHEKMNEVGDLVTEYIGTLDPETGAIALKNIEEKMMKIQQDLAKETEKTVVHKIAIDKENIDYVTSGEVPGHVLNQFSMDEYDGNFRIATTTGNWRAETSNHMYVLNDNLNIIGKVEDLAPGERIYSVRFMGGKGYMVTFRQIDPLFVIDLENPYNPQVLGYLKIPGVSDYLHPYDENHIIGVGRDASEQGMIKGMKLSLFDVTDVTNPKEISKYIIGERGTNSEALYEHKAFLFDKSKNLLVIPVSATENGKWNAYQGAYVFNLDLDEGFSLKGRVTHRNETEQDEYSYDYQASIRRSLYMDNVLYTISSKMVKMNDLDDLEEINKIDLPYEEEIYPRPLMGGIEIDE